jgi:UDP-N-acetylmuramoyl-L-alanyl-D-glutamate--2,6-diaminopimelate ligase
VNGVSFVGAGFTNISHDHLDYHITFDAYIKAKKKLFDTLPNQAFAISNKDDKRGAVMLQNSTAKKIMYGLHSNADYTLRIVENTFEGMELKIENDELHTFLIGEFNAYNLLLVYAIAIELGWDKNAVLAGISTLQPARGRFEYVKSNSGTVAIVDYAHTPDALQKIITSINQIRTRNEKLITIIGCGGDRDKLKRPEMGRIAALNSDKIILTSDNPRSENPTQIIEQMYEGIELGLRRKVTLIEDRKQAIHAACSMANAGDIILIAGKGHETYQEINGIKHPMNDLQIVTERLI